MGIIKNTYMAYISLALLAVLIWYVGDRILFIQSAEHTIGQVVEVSAYNSRCGGGRRKRSYSCTKFTAKIEFRAQTNQIHHLKISAGRSRGHNQPISHSRIKVKDRIAVIYDPEAPNKAYEDSFMGIWGTPIIIFMAQISTFFSSLFSSKKKEE